MGAIASIFFVEPDGLSNGQLLWTLITYGYVLFQASNFISDGSELLLLIPALAGVVGSIVLPVLGAVPDGMMVVFSGLGPLEVAQENVAVGVGALAGSTIMLLTLPWFLAIMGGRVDIENGECKYRNTPKLTKSFMNLTGAGIKFNDSIQVNANIMLVTSLAFLFIQVPALLVDNQSSEMSLKEVKKEAKAEKIGAFLGLLYCLSAFVWYLYLQYRAGAQDKGPDDKSVSQSSMRTCWRRLLRRLNFFIDPKWVHERDAQKMVKTIEEKGPGQLQMYLRDQHDKITQDVKTTYQPPDQSTLNQKVINRLNWNPKLQALIGALFQKFAPTGSMSESQFIIFFDKCGFRSDDINAIFKQADQNKDGGVSREEFDMCFKRLVLKSSPEKRQVVRTYYPKPAPKPEEGKPQEEDEEDEEEEAEIPEDVQNLSPEEREKVLLRRSFGMMGFGTLLVLIFSDPMVDVLAEVGKRTGVPAFYISFILAPLASNASELVSALNYASKKTQSSVTISLSTLVGAACMNNTFCLGIFYLLIFLQGLAWKFTAETASIFLVQIAMYIIIRMYKIHTMAIAFIILGLYPISLLLVYLLENVVGLD